LKGSTFRSPFSFWDLFTIKKTNAQNKMVIFAEQGTHTHTHTVSQISLFGGLFFDVTNSFQQNINVRFTTSIRLVVKERKRNSRLYTDAHIHTVRYYVYCLCLVTLSDAHLCAVSRRENDEKKI
jgi:hypothetical protein